MSQQPPAVGVPPSHGHSLLFCFWLFELLWSHFSSLFV